jgi:dihydroorotase
MGLPPVVIAAGEPVNLILFDPTALTTFSADFMKSKSQNTPFLNQTLNGSIDLVMLNNDILLHRNEVSPG